MITVLQAWTACEEARQRVEHSRSDAEEMWDAQGVYAKALAVLRATMDWDRAYILPDGSVCFLAPMGPFSLAQEVRFMKAEDLRPAKHQIVDARYAETLDRLERFQQTGKIEAGDELIEELRARSEAPAPHLPAKVRFITAGVDVFADRIEIGVWGWGDGYECWSIEHSRVYGNAIDQEPWKALDHLLMVEWSRADGRLFRIESMFVDCGFLSAAVVAFTEPRQRLGVRAAKGSDVLGPIWDRKPRKFNTGGTFHMVSARSAREILDSVVRTKVPGPRFLHARFDLKPEWFEDLLKPGGAVQDTFILALAAAECAAEGVRP